MFGFFRKRDRKPPPPWMMWAMIGVLLFAFISNHAKAPGEKSNFERTSRTIKENGIATSYGALKGRFLPSSEGPLMIKDIKKGDGNPAVCGQQVLIAYSAMLPDAEPQKTIVKVDKELPLGFTIGEANVMPIFEKSVIGMQVGGIREASGSPTLSYGLEQYKREDVPAGTRVLFTIELLKISPELPDIGAYRIIDTKAGGGNIILCGDAVNAHVTIWSVDGKKLFSTKDEGKSPIHFTTGKSEVFLGLEQGAIGMTRGGARMLIVPPSFHKTMNGNPPVAEIPLPKNQTVLVDIEALP